MPAGRSVAGRSRRRATSHHVLSVKALVDSKRVLEWLDLSRDPHSGLQPGRCVLANPKRRLGNSQADAPVAFANTPGVTL